VTADLDTRRGELYAPAGEVLPSAGGATNLEREQAPGEVLAAGGFSASRERFEAIVGWLGGEDAAGLEHAELEDRLRTDGRELLRALLQDHLELRAEREVSVDEVVDAAGVPRRAVEHGHDRLLGTVFGGVSVRRLAYRQRGEENLYVADGVLNLPLERQSHGVRRLAAVEGSKGSFEEATETIRRSSGLKLGKRQVEELARLAAVDFEGFYAARAHAAQRRDDDHDVLVLSCDGKGIVMRPEALREATAQAAQRASPKLKTRLSKGEKRNRKRIAEVGAVYDVTPAPRTPQDVLAATAQKTLPAPKAKNKSLRASVVQDAATVVADLFDEAQRRDPEGARTWVALVDGSR